MDFKNLDNQFKKNLKTKNDITKKQHFLSSFLIKSWSKEINNKNSKNSFEYKIFTPSNKKITNIILNSKEDIFFDEFFYEQADLKINEIEKQLSRIEISFSNLVKKIINVKETNIQLNLKEIIILFCWNYIQNIRTKNWREEKIKIWEKKLQNEFNNSEAYIKFYREINDNIRDLYNKIYIPSLNLKERKKVLDYEEYTKWSFIYYKKLQKSYDEVIKCIEDPDEFNKKWTEYEATKYFLHKDIFNDMFWFFSFFKPCILKTSSKFPFILSEQIFENTFLNNSFQIHNIPISPIYSIIFISRDMSFNKNTEWPTNFIEYKEYFDFEKISEQLTNMCTKDNVNLVVPIITATEDDVIKINNSLYNKSNSDNIIIPFDNKWILNIFNTKEKEKYNQCSFSFDYEGKYIITDKNGELNEKEIEAFYEKNRKGWLIRHISNNSDFLDSMLNRIRLCLLIEFKNGNQLPILFGKLNNIWYFSMDAASTWKKFEFINSYRDIKDIMFHLIYENKINFNEIKRIIITDDKDLNGQQSGYLYQFRYECETNEYFFEKILLKDRYTPLSNIKLTIAEMNLWSKNILEN